MKPSRLVDTRVIYCGDNIDQLAKLPDARSSQERPNIIPLTVRERLDEQIARKLA